MGFRSRFPRGTRPPQPRRRPRSRSPRSWCGAAPCAGGGFPSRWQTVNIGRADYNDLVIADPSVSTTHAKLQRKDDVWVLTDLGSTNGTFVEGEPVTGETALTPGTTLRFGDVAALFEPHDEPRAGEKPVTVAAPKTPAAWAEPEEARPTEQPRRTPPSDPSLSAEAERATDVADLADHHRGAHHRLCLPDLELTGIRCTSPVPLEPTSGSSARATKTTTSCSRTAACSSWPTAWAGTRPARWRARWRCGSRPRRSDRCAASATPRRATGSGTAIRAANDAIFERTLVGARQAGHGDHGDGAGPHAPPVSDRPGRATAGRICSGAASCSSSPRITPTCRSRWTRAS